MMRNSIGDSARAFALQSSSNRLKGTLDVLTQEMTSGRVADLGQRTDGNMVSIQRIEHQVRLLGQFRQTTSEAAIQADAIQDVLSNMQTLTRDVGSSLVLTATAPTERLMVSRSRDAANALSSVVSRLNMSSGGLHPFSGINTDRPPLIAADDIVNKLAILTAGLTTATDVQAAVSTWFDAPSGAGGFVDFAYRGSIAQSREVKLSTNETAIFDVDATTGPIREMMKGLSMASLIEHGSLAGSGVEQQALLVASGRVLISNEDDLIATSAGVGVTQEKIERARSANSAQLASFETARNNIVSADPFETATALAEVESQIEILHTLTARLSKLKLVEFLR